MIRSHIEKNAGTRRVLIHAEGHAGCAPKGSDLVCAAVSAHFYGLSAELYTMGRHGQLLDTGRVELGNEDGHAHIDVSARNAKAYRRILHLLAPMEQTLTRLAEDYPEAVCLTRI